MNFPQVTVANSDDQTSVLTKQPTAESDAPLPPSQMLILDTGSRSKKEKTEFELAVRRFDYEALRKMLNEEGIFLCPGNEKLTKLSSWLNRKIDDINSSKKDNENLPAMEETVKILEDAAVKAKIIAPSHKKPSNFVQVVRAATGVTRLFGIPPESQHQPD